MKACLPSNQCTVPENTKLLQKLLNPIHDLTRKGRQFIWGKEQQKEIECRLIKPPVLHLSDNKGRFHLYSNTSIFAAGSALYQIQNGNQN